MLTHQNISSTLVFMIVLGSHCNFFINLPIQMKMCKSIIFFFSKKQNVRPKNSDTSRRICAPGRADLESDMIENYA